ncbi:NAD(P)/FAD-dependent oxidoreductase [Lyngbya confervoides]|uniref:NAD(P)/FAD-dependent oxidoreductase n=1 Tax=Lyngbya confervoides BDU141951 TaxID=1574623 RepID=A0ABD4SYB1_9CYAN|nr:NAD(P)/FAD-dependent oxidoreductase [Lyngbya confervoides]MCM1981322.1 NAD(P)/FAD-dependent oxidoreductase [Lyngbya confervoides BDU141951]
MRIIVIGGGAAGFFGAITCAEANPDYRVQIVEATQSLLSKVKISGGGRCNVTHACFDPVDLTQRYPRGSRALRGPFSRFQPQDTIAWFKRRGVALKTEADGRIFPATDCSQTIVDCLCQAAHHAGVHIRVAHPVVAMQRSPAGFQIHLKSGDRLVADRVLLATGSHPIGYRLARSLGHTLIDPVPSLFTFQIKDPRLVGLAGISVPVVALRLEVGNDRFQQKGPLLVTHWGLSGPAILKLSAWAARSLHGNRYRATLVMNWLPDWSEAQLRAHLLRAKQNWPRRRILKVCPFPLPLRLWTRLCEPVEITPTHRWADLSKQALRLLGDQLQRGCFAVQGKGVFKDEFVTCGGVQLKQVNFKTMESRVCPHLYLGGELLDIDGITGGFNFQNAWTTGWIAGQAMANS